MNRQITLLLLAFNYGLLVDCLDTGGSPASSCKVYQVAGLKTKIASVVQALPKSIQILEDHQTQERTLLQSRLEPNQDSPKIYYWAGAVEKFKTAKPSCKNKGMHIVEPTSTFATLLLELQPKIQVPQSFEFADAQIWVDIYSDLRSGRAYYPSGQDVPLFWNDKATTSFEVNVPEPINAEKCYALKVPSPLTKDSTFVFVEKDCDSTQTAQKAYTLCEQTVTDEVRAISTARDTFLEELKEYSAYFTAKPEAINDLAKTAECKAENVASITEFFLNQPTQTLKNLATRKRSLPSLLALLPSYLQDLSSVKQFLSNLEFSTLSLDGLHICFCSVPEVESSDSISQVMQNNEMSTSVASSNQPIRFTNDISSVAGNQLDNTLINGQTNNVRTSTPTRSETSPNFSDYIPDMTPLEPNNISSGSNYFDLKTLGQKTDELLNKLHPKHLSLIQFVISIVGSSSAFLAFVVSSVLFCHRYRKRKQIEKRNKKLMAVKMDTFSKREEGTSDVLITHKDSSSDSETSIHVHNSLPNEIVLLGSAKNIAKHSTLQLNPPKRKPRKPRVKGVKRVTIRDSPSLVYKTALKPVSHQSLSSDDGIVPFEKTYYYASN